MASGRLRGVVGQRMTGRLTKSRILQLHKFGPGSGSVTSPAYPTLCELWAWGGGGGGAISGQGAGGGGAASYFAFRCSPVQVLSYVVGGAGAGNFNGGDTVVTTPTGYRVTAGGGVGAAGDSGTSGGVASGGILNRNGGAGGGSLSAALPGDFGGAGGGNGGGGGAAGFSDEGNFLLGGSGAAGGVGGTTPGGGGNHASGVAGSGQLFIAFTRVTQI